ncbi:MAG: ImmA/IrrE family metallo-endopeptidase [Chloroflexi bacterium]|nr:ImmA/IrrE family metallo-endopeptidase [Chloroflexota bacterium]
MFTIEAHITPLMLRWARERKGDTLQEAALKITVTPETLLAWEEGEAKPSFAKVRSLAQKLNVPFGYLFLEKPPEERLPLPDLRTVAGAPPRKPSPEFLDVLYDALRKQDWFREHLQAEGAEPITFIGRFNGDSPRVVAADIRSTLGVTPQFRRSVATWEAFLTQLIDRAENARVLVLRSSYAGRNTRRSLDVKEFRGFAISDPIAPLIFINSADSKAAQIFTLAHELAHLWIGASGVSNPNYLERPQDQQHATDKHCDAIAAEVLVPQDDFVLAWNALTTVDQNINELARRYRVSTFVVLRRAYELERVDPSTYRQKYRELLAGVVSTKGEGGGSFYNTFLVRNSRTFTTTLVLSAAEGRASAKEAATLLNVRLGTLSRVEQYILTSMENA